MITIKESHFRLKQEINKLNANYFKALTPYEMDILLYAAQLAQMAEKVSWQKGKGFEFDPKLTRELGHLLIHKETVIPVSNEINETMLTHKIYRPIRFTARVTNNGCSKTIEECKFRRHDLLTFETQKDNFQWGILNGYVKRFNTNQLAITFNPPFTINEIYLTYIKYPREVSIGGYTDINGTVKTTVEWEMPDEVILEIIKKAAYFALEEINPNTQTKLQSEELFH